MSLMAHLTRDAQGVVGWVTSIPSFILGALFSAVLLYVRQKISQYLARRKMAERDFLDRINVSLNVFADGKLKIRTLFERPLSEIIHNPHVGEELQRAALAASNADDPIVRLPREQSWFVLNCVLNAIAERFSEGAFREERGLDVAREVYAFWITCEPVKNERERKIRVFLLKQDLLKNFPFLESMPELEAQKHEDRVLSLRQSCRLFQTNPELFSSVEICT